MSDLGTAASLAGIPPLAREWYLTPEGRCRGSGSAALQFPLLRPCAEDLLRTPHLLWQTPLWLNKQDPNPEPFDSCYLYDLTIDDPQIRHWLPLLAEVLSVERFSCIPPLKVCVAVSVLSDVIKHLSEVCRCPAGSLWCLCLTQFDIPKAVVEKSKEEKKIVKALQCLDCPQAGKKEVLSKNVMQWIYNPDSVIQGVFRGLQQDGISALAKMLRVETGCSTPPLDSASALFHVSRGVLSAYCRNQDTTPSKLFRRLYGAKGTITELTEQWHRFLRRRASSDPLCYPALLFEATTSDIKSKVSENEPNLFPSSNLDKSGLIRMLVGGYAKMPRDVNFFGWGQINRDISFYVGALLKLRNQYRDKMAFARTRTEVTNRLCKLLNVVDVRSSNVSDVRRELNGLWKIASDVVLRSCDAVIREGLAAFPLGNDNISISSPEEISRDGMLKIEFREGDVNSVLEYSYRMETAPRCCSAASGSICPHFWHFAFFHGGLDLQSLNKEFDQSKVVGALSLSRLPDLFVSCGCCFQPIARPGVKSSNRTASIAKAGQSSSSVVQDDGGSNASVPEADADYVSPVTKTGCCKKDVHVVCLEQWFREKKTCPYCRTGMTRPPPYGKQLLERDVFEQIRVDDGRRWLEMWRTFGGASFPLPVSAVVSDVSKEGIHSTGGQADSSKRLRANLSDGEDEPAAKRLPLRIDPHSSCLGLPDSQETTISWCSVVASPEFVRDRTRRRPGEHHNNHLWWFDVPLGIQTMQSPNEVKSVRDAVKWVSTFVARSFFAGFDVNRHAWVLLRSDGGKKLLAAENGEESVLCHRDLIIYGTSEEISGFSRAAVSDPPFGPVPDSPKCGILLLKLNQQTDIAFVLQAPEGVAVARTVGELEDRLCQKKWIPENEVIVTKDGCSETAMQLPRYQKLETSTQGKLFVYSFPHHPQPAKPAMHNGRPLEEQVIGPLCSFIMDPSRAQLQKCLPPSTIEPAPHDGPCYNAAFFFIDNRRVPYMLVVTHGCIEHATTFHPLRCGAANLDAHYRMQRDRRVPDLYGCVDCKAIESTHVEVRGWQTFQERRVTEKGLEIDFSIRHMVGMELDDWDDERRDYRPIFDVGAFTGIRLCPDETTFDKIKKHLDTLGVREMGLYFWTGRRKLIPRAMYCEWVTLASDADVLRQDPVRRNTKGNIPHYLLTVEWADDNEKTWKGECGSVLVCGSETLETAMIQDSSSKMKVGSLVLGFLCFGEVDPPKTLSYFIPAWTVH